MFNIPITAIAPYPHQYTFFNSTQFPIPADLNAAATFFQEFIPNQQPFFDVNRWGNICMLLYGKFITLLRLS